MTYPSFQLTYTDLIESEQIPMPTVVAKTYKNTRWRAIVHILESLDTDGDIFQLFLEVPGLRKILENVSSRWLLFRQEAIKPRIGLVSSINQGRE